ncbi:MAG: hypothetical protein HYU69_12155 [Bacteroidetes bacterium]|nr:hypothetical protein [Bacteroidota bacterium]
MKFSGILFFLMEAITIVELIDAHDGFEVITKRIQTSNKKILYRFYIVIFCIIANVKRHTYSHENTLKAQYNEFCCNICNKTSVYPPPPTVYTYSFKGMPAMPRKNFYRNFFSSVIIISGFLIIPFFSFSQVSTFTSVDAGGNWETPATWTAVGTDVDGIPDADDIVIVTDNGGGGPAVVTINSAAACSDLTIGNSGNDATLTIVGTNSLAVGDDLDFNSGNNGGVYTLNVNGGTLTVADLVTNNLGTGTGAGTKDINITTGLASFTKAVGWTWARDVDVDVTGVGGQVTVTAPLTMNTANATNFDLLANGTLTFNGLVTQTNGNITNTGTAGTINFNGGYSLDNTNSVFTTMAGTTVNFGGSFTVLGGAEIFNATSTAVFYLNTPSTVTPTSAITFGHFQINSGINVTFAAGTINVAGNWTNLGGTFTSGTNTVTFNGTGIQTITKTTGETFYNLTSNTTGPLTLASTTDVTVTNILTMTAGNYNLNGRTLQLGNAAASTLTYTAGIMYGGTFKRWWPIAAISSTVAPRYGLFPMGTSASYRPVAINLTAGAITTGDYVSATHTSVLSVTDVTPFADPVTTITRKHDAQFVLSSGALAGGTYSIDVSMTNLGSTGALGDIRLAVSNGASTVTTVGTHAAATGTVPAPTAKRTGLSAADLTGDFRISTTNLVATPLTTMYYGRDAGSGLWSDPTAWSTSAPSGASCGCIPGAGDNVIINSENNPITMTVDGAYSITNVTIGDGSGTDLDNAILTVSGTNSLTITGTLQLNVGNKAFNYTLDAATGTISVAGAVTMSTVNASQQSLRVSTGTLTFSLLLNLANDVDQDITFTGAGTVNFNGGLTDNGAGVITTIAGCTANFGGSYTNVTTAMTWNATSNAVFTGSGTITPTAAITFGHVQINSGITVTQAGSFEVAGNWTNNGGTLAQSVAGWTVTFTGTATTIGGTAGTAFPNLNIGTAAIDATISLTGGFTYSCVNLALDDGGGGGATVVTLTHSGTEVLNVSGNVNLIQPGAGQTNGWYINGGTGSVTGTLTFTGTNNTAARVQSIVITGGSFSVTGAVTWMANGGPGTAMPVATEVITVSTGTVTFGSSLSMPDGSGTLSVTGSGTINFNGVAAPSFNFFNGAANANEINPVFTTSSGSTLNFLTGFTNSNAALVIADGSTSVFTGSGTITPNAAITFGNLKINATPIVTLAVAGISVTNDWTNLGGTFTPSTFGVTFNGTGTQTITKTGGETFYNLTTNTTGPLTLASNVTVTSLLTMTAGNYNLSTYTLQLGNGAASTLTRTAGIMYNGTGGNFKRYWPVGAITSGSGSYYGLFPIGSSTQYRPITINSTVSPTGAGYLSASHTDANTVTDVSIPGTPGTVTRITDQQSIITNSAITGGTYDLDVVFSTLSATGAYADMRLVVPVTGGIGTHVIPTVTTVDNPTGERDALTIADLANTWVLGTINTTTTPLRQYYYSRKNGNWNDATVGNGTWSYTSGGAGPSCDCVPVSTGNAVISVGQTVSVNVVSTIDFVDISNTATLDGTANFTVNKDLATAGSGKFTPTAGNWTITRNLTTVGTGSSSLSGASTVTGILNIGTGTILTMSGGVGLTVTGNLVVDGTLALGTSTMILNGISGTTISGSAGAASITGAGATVSVTTANKTISTGTNLTIAPVFAITGAITVTNNGTVTLTGDMTGSVAGSTWTNAASSTLNMGGTTSALLTTGTLNASASPNTVNYSGSGAQTIKTPASSYYNLTASNSGTKSLLSPGPSIVTVTNLVTIQDAAILDEAVNGNNLTGAGGLTMTGTSELIVRHDAGATFPMLTGAYTLSAGTVTVNYGTAGTATIRGVTYYNLSLIGSRNHNCSAVTTITNNLTVSGTADISLNGILTVGNAINYSSTDADGWILTNNVTTGSLTMSTGFTAISASTYNITINGSDWTNSSTDAIGFDAGTGTVLFTGTAAQTISGATSTTFNNLTINNTSATGVTLSQPISAAGILTLTDGYLYTDATNLITMNAGSSVSGVSNSSFVYGPMAKVGSTDFTFPIGKDVQYRSISISSLSGSETFTATYFHSDPNLVPYDVTSKDASLNHIGRCEYWTLTEAGTQDAWVTLSWDSYSCGVDDMAAISVGRWDGSVWKDHGTGTTTGAVSPATGTVRSSTIITSTFSAPGAFTLGSNNTNNPLPIELLSFEAVLNNAGKVNTAWVTATETNNDYFTVEKSTDGIHFEFVGKVNGAGNSTTIRNYSLTDDDPYTGVSYYRLKQIDYDGKYSFSNLVAVENAKSINSVIIFPNPSNGVINVIINGVIGNEVLLILYDVLGNMAYSKTVVNTNSNDYFSTTINSENNLAPGVYYVVAYSKNVLFRNKIIIK